MLRFSPAAYVVATTLTALCSSAEELHEADRTVASCDVVVVAGKVLGCRGTWTRSPQCPDGWHECNTLPPAAAAKCQTDLGGFFTANVLLSRAGSDLRCEVVPRATQFGLAGCGAKPQLGNTEAITPTCNGFSLAVACSPATGYMCSASSAYSSNNFSKNGVLCCR